MLLQFPPVQGWGLSSPQSSPKRHSTAPQLWQLRHLAPLSPSPIEEVVTTTTTIPSSPTPACKDNLTYLEDQTIPDGSIVQAGEVMDKRWLVENSGTCNWNEQLPIKVNGWSRRWE